MNDDIIRMAREAGIDWHSHWNDDESNRLEHFAKLARADEREACAKVVTANAHMFATPQAAESLANAIRARGNT